MVLLNIADDVVKDTGNGGWIVAIGTVICAGIAYMAKIQTTKMELKSKKRDEEEETRDKKLIEDLKLQNDRLQAAAHEYKKQDIQTQKRLEMYTIVIDTLFPLIELTLKNNPELKPTFDNALKQLIKK